ncbi:MAG TPA: hypothetical protein VH682_06440 [Gemmataceae bacterium]
MTRSLLIIACSQRKVAGLAAGAAWDVYDGVVYRVLKKRLGPRNNWPAWFDLLIVSAKYGVIRPGRRIQPYDQTMPVSGRQGRWAGALRRLVASYDYRFVHVNLGRAYQAAIGDIAALFPKAEVTAADGGIGQRAAQTTTWITTRLAGQTSQPSSSHPLCEAGSRPGTRRRNPLGGRPQALS